METVFIAVRCVMSLQTTQKAQVPLDDYEIEKVLLRLDAGKEGKISYQYALCCLLICKKINFNQKSLDWPYINGE